jgi:hypothetical protein
MFSPTILSHPPLPAKEMVERQQIIAYSLSEPLEGRQDAEAGF